MYRLYIERKPGFENEAARIKSELTGFLGITGITGVRYLNRYDIDNVSETVIQAAAARIFSEPQSDYCFFTHIPLDEEDTVIAWEYLPGQYDQRADSAAQCLSLLNEAFTPHETSEGSKTSSAENPPVPAVRCAKMVILHGSVSARDIARIEKYLINPVDSRSASLDIPSTLEMKTEEPSAVPIENGFTMLNKAALDNFRKTKGLAMDSADILFLQNYFIKAGRDPTETEIRVLDTYWSDHCRHTTFNTVLEKIDIEDGDFSDLFKKSLEEYKTLRVGLYGEKTADGGLSSKKPVTLMDMAVIGAKYLRKFGKLDDLEVSEEINACSIYIDVDVEERADNAAADGGTEAKTERWLLMFKNETHNHPTEIEPFGGAATCIGGAIRDPLSGRSWVYQALRVTGAGDPTVPVSHTRDGKLPQMKLTREAAAGFSSYGNQIGLTTGQVAEIYHPGFEAKRMELGAVIAAAPADMVMRETPEAGDVIVLVGGGTGRDGIGGATGSSKAHTAESVSTAAAEVQKGNAVEERKIQRLFRNTDVSAMIRRCNDFGAGGVAVAVGELAPGLEIDLDAVPKKYEGLNGTEIAISESQERMAIVVREKDAAALIKAAAEENLNASIIARVTDTNRLVMKWKGETIVDIDRAFLDTAGAQRSADVKITSPSKYDSPLCRPLESTAAVLGPESAVTAGNLEKAWIAGISDLACCSQRGLTERFDGSIGSSSVLFPMGGTCQSTPEAGMAAKIPVLSPKETQTVSLMTFGYDPRVAQWSPYHGAQTAVLYSLAKITALGGDAEKARLTFQEYFERTSSAEAWGKPAAALLGALSAQIAMDTPAIGGKDSMSGSFKELTVPPTLVSFAVTTEHASRVVSGAFKKSGSYIYAVLQSYEETLAPDFSTFRLQNRKIRSLNAQGKIRAMYPVGPGGIAEAVTKMTFGNKIGCSINDSVRDFLFNPMYGSIIVETSEMINDKGSDDQWLLIGRTHETQTVDMSISDRDGIKVSMSIEQLLAAWEKPLAQVFPPLSNKAAEALTSAADSALPDFAARCHPSVETMRAKQSADSAHTPSPADRGITGKSIHILKKALPRILLPVFPGTNCEYDMARAFRLGGGDPKIVVFRNNSVQALEESLELLAKEIEQAQILALSGGFSAGDEPDGSGKFIANVLREPLIAQRTMDLLKKRDGLILGICNGFQALIKTGLVPYGEIIDTPDESMPTLTYNTIGRHISRAVRTRLTSALSPWANDPSVTGPETHIIPISHGEGRIIISNEKAQELFTNGQVFTQYADIHGNPVMAEPDNPNGSAFAIEGITSPDGRVLGKMGHNERTITHHDDLLKNIEGNKCQNIFAAGVRYFSS